MDVILIKVTDTVEENLLLDSPLVSVTVGVMAVVEINKVSSNL